MLGRVWGVLDALFMAGIYFFLYTVIRGAGAIRPTSCPSSSPAFPVRAETGALGERRFDQAREDADAELDLPRALLPHRRGLQVPARFAGWRAVFAIVFPLAGGEARAGPLRAPATCSPSTW